VTSKLYIAMLQMPCNFEPLRWGGTSITVSPVIGSVFRNPSAGIASANEQSRVPAVLTRMAVGRVRLCKPPGKNLSDTNDTFHAAYVVFENMAVEHPVAGIVGNKGYLDLLARG
jgi:hypothetical protein